MSKPIDSIDALALETVTGGATVSSRCSTSDTLLNQLTSLASTIKDIGTATKGFSSTDMLMLGLLLAQRRQVNVVVGPRYYW